MQTGQPDRASNTAEVIPSLRELGHDPLVQTRVTIPCRVRVALFKLSQSTKELLLKDGKGLYCRYYTVIKEDKQHYVIKGVRTLRKRRTSMPTAVKKRDTSMNHPNGRSKWYPPHSNRGSGSKRPSGSSPEGYPKYQHFDGMSRGNSRHGPSRFQGNRYNSRGSWGRGSFRGQRENRGGFSPAANHFGQRTSYSFERTRTLSPERTWERDGRAHRPPDSHRYVDSDRDRKRRHSSPDRLNHASLSSTYRSSVNESMQKSIVTIKPLMESSKNPSDQKKVGEHKQAERSSEGQASKRDVSNCGPKGKTDDQNVFSGTAPTSDKDSKSTSNKTTTELNHMTKKKTVLNMSQEIERLKGEQHTSNSHLIKVSTKESPSHKEELPLQNHVNTVESNDPNNIGKVKDGALPKRIYSARKSAPSSSASAMQRKEMLKKQALLKADDSAEKASRSSPDGASNARMTAAVKDSPEDIASGSVVKDHTDASSSKIPSKEQPSPAAPDSMEATVLPEEQKSNRELAVGMEDSQISADERKAVPTSRAPAEDAEPQDRIPSTPNSAGDQEAIASSTTDAAGGTALSSDHQPKATTKTHEKAEDHSKSKGKALLKIKENLKKNLQKGRVTPEARSPSSRPGSAAGSNSPPASPPCQNDADNSLHDTQGQSCANNNNLKNDVSGAIQTGAGKGLSDSNISTEQETETIGKVSSDIEVCKSENPIENEVANMIKDEMLKELENNSSQSDSHEEQPDLPHSEVICEASHTADPLEDASVSDGTLSELQNEEGSNLKDEDVPNQGGSSDTFELSEGSSSRPKDRCDAEPVDDDAGNMSDMSVDLGPDEPGDMDSLDDDILLDEDPSTEKDDLGLPSPTADASNPTDGDMESVSDKVPTGSDVTELSISKIESQGLDDPETSSSEPRVLPTKRTLSTESDGEEPLSKKSKSNEEEAPEEEGSADASSDVESSESPVVFTHKEWKEFALSIKEKYEKLVQTFNQKTNAMYDAQARWDQETRLWRRSYEELEKKYKLLEQRVEGKPTTELHSVKVQTVSPSRKTRLSRRKKDRSRHSSKEDQPLDEALESSQQDMETESSDAPATSTSGTLHTATSDLDSIAATATSQDSNSSSSSGLSTGTGTGAGNGSSKPSHLEAKRKIFKATLNKVIQNKKISASTSSTSEPPSSPTGQTSSLDDSETRQLSSSPSSGEATGESEMVKETPSTEPRESGSDLDDAPQKSLESKSVDGPNSSGNASGTVSAPSPKEKSGPQAAPCSTAPPATSTIPSQTTSAPTTTTTTSTTAASTSTALPSKAPSQSSSVPSKPSDPVTGGKTPATPQASQSQGQPKPAAGSAKPSEAAKNTPASKNWKPADSSKDSPAGGKTSEAEAEPEVIDLTDEPDMPANASKPSAPSTHKQQSAPPSTTSRHATLTTRSPHALVNSPTIPTLGKTQQAGNRPGSAGAVASPASGSRQMQGSPNHAMQTPSPQKPSGQSPATRTRPSSAGQVPSAAQQGASSTQGNRQTSAYDLSTTSNYQLRNVKPPVVSTQGLQPNVRTPVVNLQHGPRQQVVQVSAAQAHLQQVQQTPATQVVTVVSGIPGASAGQVIGRAQQGQVTLQQRVQQQQQPQPQISLQMLQQQRQGVHQLPGAAASAAALATRQPQAAWLQQPGSRQQLVVSSHSGINPEIVLSPAQMQLQLLRAQQAQTTTTTSTLQTRPQPAQQPLPYQGLTRPPLTAPSTSQEQIQAQERAHALSQAQAQATAVRREQQQLQQQQQQQARLASARIQAAQQGQQQQYHRAQLKKLQEQKLEHQQQAQEAQNRKRQLMNQIQRYQEHVRALGTKLKEARVQRMDPHRLHGCEKQIRNVQDQENQCRTELAVVEDRLRTHLRQNSQLDEQLACLSGGNPSQPGLSPQELQQQQLQLQQQQLHQQLAQQQLQQRPRQMQVADSERPRHPAALPDLFKLPEFSMSTRYTPHPLKPLLEIKHSMEGIVLSWKADPEGGQTGKVETLRYLLYAYQESESATPSTDLWKKIGAVDAMPLPMACTLTHFKAGSMYHFAVCAVSKHNRPGKFSNIGSINLP